MTKIKSFAKVNLSLGVLKKNENKMHQIESIFFFINLHDEIIIKKSQNINHKITFTGRFSKNIGTRNTIKMLLDTLEKYRILGNQKFKINIRKNIPIKSGLGGGSMNAATLLNYLLDKKIIKLSNVQLIRICKLIGSDVLLGTKKNLSVLKSSGELLRFDKKLKFYCLLIKPQIGCSTKEIYKGVKSFSAIKLKSINSKNLNLNFIKLLSNDLEKVAFKKYPSLKYIKKSLENTGNFNFVRMTGSGSCIIGYSSSKKSCLNALKLIKKKYKKHWCVISKAI